MTPEQEIFFETSFRDHVGKLTLYASKQLRNPHGVEEVVQDTFYTALDRIEIFQEHEKPGAYLMEILKFKIRAYQRTKARNLKVFLPLEKLFSSEAAAASDNIPFEFLCIMEAAQKVLTPDEQHILSHYIAKGYSHLEISKELDISVWASQKRVERIRKKLIEFLQEHGT